MSSMPSAARDWSGINAAVEAMSTVASITIASNARLTRRQRRGCTELREREVGPVGGPVAGHQLQPTA
jgi:hypothetical protein